jgi:LuxR family maltose regulon positive regulatory protein
MTVTLLQTKLYAPPIRPELVSRPRLIERLNAGLHCKLTLVSAPAGFGKTTLVAEWLHSRAAPLSRETGERPGVRAAWLSLDEGDSDPARFFAYLVAVLQQVDPAIGQSAQAMLQGPQPPPPEPLLTALINDIAAVSQPFVLVLDDYHVISALPVHQQLAFLLDHQPPQMHLVIATREDPPLPLSRLRARGQVTDIRRPDLQFAPEETAEFLQRVTHADLPADDVVALQRRTEGWVAGLQLLALSIRGSDDVRRLVDSFTGSNRYVLDYLVEEVFQQQSESIRVFLLKTSMLDRLSGPLCDAVVGEIGDWRSEIASCVQSPISGRQSQAILEYLESSNLFIFPLDESRQWYRYHRLFADLLRHRLQIELGDEVDELHRRASQWYADNGFPDEGVRHALAASDWERATDLIKSGIDDDFLKQGQMATLLGWYQALPEEVVRADPRLCIQVAWPLILTEQLDGAESYLALAERAAEAGGDDALLGDVAVAQVHIARVRGDNQRAMALSERALELLPPDHLSGRCVVAVNLGIAQWFQGRLAEAERTLAEAERAGRGSGNDYGRIAALTFLGRIQAARGKPHQAAESCRELIRLGGQNPMVALAHYDLARLLYEWNDLDAATDHLRQGIALSQRGSPEFQAGGYGTLALVEQARGNEAAAEDALQRAAQLLESADISPATRLYNLVACILVALAQGDLEAAGRMAEQAPKPEESGSFPDCLFLMLARVRLLLAQGQREAAARCLAALQGMASQAGWQSVLVQARVLQALTIPEPDGALAALAEALALAEPLGYVRVFVDAGEPMRALLREAAARGVAVDYVRKLLAALGSEAKDEGRRTKEEQASVIHPPSLVESLSDRELDVLRLLADGQTNQEIALALCVSVNTVKTHLKNVYGKLGVSSRRQAAVQAKKLGLVG